MRKAKNSRMVTMHATVCRPEKATLSKFSGWVEDSYLSVCGARAGDTQTHRHTDTQTELPITVQPGPVARAGENTRPMVKILV